MQTVDHARDVGASIAVDTADEPAAEAGRAEELAGADEMPMHALRIEAKQDGFEHPLVGEGEKRHDELLR